MTQAVIQTASSRTFGNCLKSFTVYDAAGNGVASICNYDPDSNPDPETAAEAVALFDESRPEWNRVTVHEYDPLGRRFKTTTDAGASYAQTTLTVYDALNRVVRVIRHYVADGAVPHPFIAARESFNPGPDQTWNQITGTTYNARGMVRRTVDVLGNATLYGYDAAGRLVKTISSASLPDYPNEYLQNESEEWIGDPELKDYPLSDAPDLDLVSLSEYDAAGNLVKSVNPLGQVTFTVYDALNRPLKTVRYAKPEATVALNVGDAGYNAAHDPRSDAYQPSEEPDRDHIDLTAYDRMGRVVRSRDALGAWTLFAYDGLGRQVKVIRSASQPTYDLDSDPDLSAYLPEDTPDQDLVTETVYDPQGRVMYAQEALGRRTWSAYDGVGRTTRTVHNAVGSATDGGAHDPRSPHYHPVLNLSDRDQIALTEYDLDGRVLWTQDYLGRRTWIAYDGLGRTVRTITHAVGTATDGSPSDPRSPVYLTSAEPDRDLVSHTRYDSQGRVAATVDTLGNETHYTYDVLGRRITTITNFVTGSFELQHPDRDLLSQTIYDRAGRVTETIDPRGTRTTFIFDRLGRRVSSTTAAGTALATTDYTCYNRGGQVQRVIRNYRPRPTDPPPDALEETREGWSHTFDFTRSAQPWVSNYWGAYEPGTGFKTENRSDSYGTYEVVDPVITFPHAVTLTRIEMHFTVTGRGGTPYFNDGDYFYADCNRPGGCPPAFPHLAFWHLLGDSVSPRVWTGRTVLRSLRLQLLTTALQNPSLHHGVISQVVLEGVGDDPFKTTPRYLFSPEWHGQNADQNLITTFVYDGGGRQLEVTDPAGGKTLMSYDKGGRLLTQTDPLGSVTAYRYDHLGRRVLVVQNWAAAGLSDPAEWHWDDTHWVDGKGTVVAHGELNDRNLPVQVEYDKGGRMLALRDPRGHRSTYTYDLLDRRRSLTDPLNQRWETAYFNLNGTTRTEHTNPLQQVTRHDTDEAGRLKRVEYLDESPKLTPDVFFSYDKGGRRVAMDESLDLGSTWVRRTQFSHDLAGRLNQVAFDTDGDGTPEQTVSYRYEAGGLRTQLILPEGQTVTYQYDVRGQLVGVTDWEDNPTTFRFDQVGRLVQSQRANGFASQYAYDAGGRLVRLSHTRDGQSLGHFEYTVDGRGNRIQTLECLPRVGGGGTTLLHDDPAVQSVRGVWEDVAGFRQTTSLTAALRLSVVGTALSLSMGVGPDHSLFEVYVNGSLWRTVNGYAPQAGVTTLEMTLSREGPHHIEVRNRNDRDLRATGYTLRFHKLESNRAYDLHTLTYHYDALSRLVNADYHPGANPTSTPFREYAYQYDGAGNRTRETMTVEGVPTITNWTYNGMNQISSGGVTYDAAGRMTSDGTNPYTWDRADRLLSMGGLDYTYNGLGQRIGQSHNGLVTSYLNDLQPGLVKLLNSDTEGDITWYLHTSMGIHQQQNPDQSWVYPVQDGLGSVRAVVDAAGQILESRLYAPYGDLFGGSSTAQTGFGFTGEQTDASGLVYLRARYYAPGLGVFPSLDPVEGVFDQPPSLNRYGYAQQNPINWTDPSGLQTSKGCGNKPCKTLLDEMYEAIMGGLKPDFKGLAQRFVEMFEDRCYQFDASQNQPYIGVLPPECASTTSDWRGHQTAFDQTQNRLDHATGCYETRGMQKFKATGDHSDRCDQNDPTYQASLAWSRKSLPSGQIKPQRHAGAGAPPRPPAPFFEVIPLPVFIPNICDSCEKVNHLIDSGIIVGGALIAAAALYNLCGGGGIPSLLSHQ